MIYLALIAIIVVLYYVKVKFQRRNWPPGPFPYPVIGNLVEVVRTDSDQPFRAIHKLSKKYGPIYMLKVGVLDNVVISGWKEIKEAVTLDEIMDRPTEDWLLDRCFNSSKNGLFFSTFQHWRVNRRFTQRTLKDFGFGKVRTMDDLILEEFQVLVQRIKKTTEENNGLLRLELAFNAAFVNIIYASISGMRFSQDDPKLHEFVNCINDWFASSNFVGGALGAFPFLKDWAPEMSGFSKNHESTMKLLEYFRNLIKSFRETGEYKSNPSNFIEVMLNRIDEGPQHDDYDEPIFTDNNLICLINDLFAAGSETSANSTAFAVRHLVQRPDIQKKLQDEIDHLVGKDRWVQLSDRPLLPYVEAFMYEVLRTNSVVPLSPRKCRAPCKVAGYEMPVNCNVLINNYTANNDKSIWGDPEAFRPERFLNEKNELTNTEKIVTFSFGKRDCIGQNVAKSMLFMAIACFMQHFTFLPDPVAGPPGSEYTKTLTIAPVPFNTLVQLRSSC